MTYNPDDLETLKEGTREESEIIEIEEGIQGELRDARYWEGFKSSAKAEVMKKRSCIKIVCRNGANEIFTIFEDNRIPEKSRLGMFKKTYNDFPRIGLKVRTKVENGFWKIVLES